MLFIKVHKKDAERTRKKLVDRQKYDKNYLAFSEGDFVFFPVTKEAKETDGKDGLEIIKRRGTKVKRPESIGQILKESISSFDMIGDIAIVEIPEKMTGREKEIANAIMKVHKSIHSVYKKMSAMKGEYRVRELKHIAGIETTETIYKEHGCSMKLDVAKVYFSPRLATERKRIADIVGGRAENIMIMFAGVGPFALVIGKQNPDAKLIAIELNPDAVRYMRENVKLNKLANVQVIEGDVRKVTPRNCADRIAMPLPHSAEDFLDVAFSAAKNGCIIHFYAMVDLKDMPDKAINIVKKAAERERVKVEILNWKIVRPYAPKVNQIVIDLKVRK
ncbi:MAG: class I SAM-dependent methyltransferase family protein [Candidatus Micrarchaeota archaeon]